MAYGAWRGMVGTVKPTKGSGSLEELIRMLPDGIGVIPLFNNIRHGTIGEFRDVLPSYEEKVAELAADRVDLIHPAGTPPFMLLGYRKEQELIAAWESKYGLPIFTVIVVPYPFVIINSRPPGAAPGGQRRPGPARPRHPGPCPRCRVRRRGCDR